MFRLTTRYCINRGTVWRAFVSIGEYQVPVPIVTYQSVTVSQPPLHTALVIRYSLFYCFERIWRRISARNRKAVLQPYRVKNALLLRYSHDFLGRKTAAEQTHDDFSCWQPGWIFLLLNKSTVRCRGSDY